jgi:hypothetical protein
MALSNSERIGKALELLANGLLPFVEREMKAKYNAKWEDVAKESMMDKPAGKGKKFFWDAHALLNLMWGRWNDVFRDTLGQAERSIVSELISVRNNWAHQQPFSTDDAYRALDSMGRLLSAVSAAETEEIEKMKQEVLRVKFEEQRRTEARKTVNAPVEGKPAGGLKPWREIVTPHPDVASGRYQQAEFAADLWQVYIGEGSDEYKHPAEFFRRTYLTEGLKVLLKNALVRLSGKGGDPVVELQTNFGGGKTHSMLALWHLFSGVNTAELAGVEAVLKDAGADAPKSVKRAVVVGTRISPGQPHKKPDGTVIRTLWGEIAWQLGGKEGYKMLKEADETATNPGDALRILFNKYSPCLILIDEWVAYARQLHEETGLAGGTFETQFTFAQNLTESVKAAKNALLVVSVPASEKLGSGEERISDIEIGGDRGREALARLKNAIGRVEASWRPASQEEGFEIVRRRLFQPITEREHFVARDNVARGFSDMYSTQHQEFPSECREASYERRIKAAYPIHPELFDKLYSDWSTLDKFQRTRGVLRLMAAVIHSLWERQDNNLLIMPANVPISESRVQFELTRYLEDSWVPVIEKDVDGEHSLPFELDRDNPNLMRFSASRRVARTIYMGSAPIHRSANRGIDERHVKLGCVQPGESVATFGDALRRLTDQATYLYVDGKRYWYSTLPTVTRLADDRASQIDDADVIGEIQRRLREESRMRADFSKVHACVSCGDVPDEEDTRLVILGPEFTHASKKSDSEAKQEAAKILESRGLAPRQFKNTIVFLAPDANRILELKQAVRMYLAWNSIYDEREMLNLDAFQTKQAETKRNSSEDMITARIPETYQWLLVPCQKDPNGSVEWVEYRQQGSGSLAERAGKKMKNEGLLCVVYGGTLLRKDMDAIPLWRGNHVAISQLTSDYSTYLYLSRLKDTDVLFGAIKDGLGLLTWKDESFAYADGWDDKKKKYIGLRYGAHEAISDNGLLVRPDVAIEQIKSAEKASGISGEREGAQSEGDTPTPETKKKDEKEPRAPILRRFHGSVKLDPARIGRDAGRIAEEVIQHFINVPDCDIEVSLEINARIASGASDKVVRTISENCRTLKFREQGFETE